MCGICGVIGTGGVPSPADEAAVLRMSSAMVHRGPDDHGEFRAPGVLLGARRLSIIDVDGGHQPFTDDSGRVTAVQNGEIYNHDELRHQLEGVGHRFTSRCDTEVIPHLYRRHGLDFAHRLRGMFAIALWDDDHDRAVLVRDRMGIKPLYYARVADRLVFASELKCIVSSGLAPLDLDFEAISAYLELGFFPGARTPFANVSKLPAGHRLVVEGGRHRVEQWWEYPLPSPGPTGPGVRHYAEGLLEELDEAVRLRLMSDVPFGAMLSGGLDSSLVVALMAPRLADPVKTFSVGFTEDHDGNELPVARRVAEMFGCDHHEVEMSMTTDTPDFPALAWHLDEPVADLSALGFFALCGIASKEVTMALSGQGADELLGGYRKHRMAAFTDRSRVLPRLGGLVGGRVAGALPDTWGRVVQSLAAGDPGSRVLAMSALPTFGREALTGGLAAVPPGAARRAVETHASRLPRTVGALPATLYLDAQLALVDSMLHYFDRMSMAHSLEVRVPFLDHRVVEYCATIPARFKVHGSVTKYALKVAAEGLLPPDVIHRRKVGFFRQATGRWFASQVGGVLEEVLLDPGARYTRFLDRSAVQGALRAAQASGEESAQRGLIALLVLELWLSQCLPRASAT
ncbi:amidotransferase 1, exosortase A system-associated [Geodermatophilus aquaeductus]|uniref:asparagine synthase (glutamine-hydrolyzing) n=1 Tax=Geodermatophilus aquaeductus TaxID=1564161 RepID=A0A521CNQ6_9ACTN|nr:asparagine synthase (glutamine-hydrolyzing) [Geodermatophilus aquaeductus]SMO61094.1 asparagine synthase (glutamine-hydrolysing) [Geodermatophilus aquaeductus]